MDRVVATSPEQIVVRVNGSARRVRFQCRTRDDNAGVRVIGLTDDLGHAWAMSLPGREFLRVSRQPSRG